MIMRLEVFREPDHALLPLSLPPSLPPPHCHSDLCCVQRRHTRDAATCWPTSQRLQGEKSVLTH